MAKKTQDDVDPIQKELSDIKRLMVLALLHDCVPQKTIATALGVSEATMSRMFPKGISSSLNAARKSKS